MSNAEYGFDAQTWIQVKKNDLADFFVSSSLYLLLQLTKSNAKFTFFATTIVDYRKQMFPIFNFNYLKV